MNKLLFITLLVGAVSAAKRECEAMHPKVGCMAELREFTHDVGGVIQIDDDCTFSVNLTYDGTGPDVFWYGAETEAGLASGIIIEEDVGLPRSHGPWDNELVVAQIPEDVTWDEINVLSVWCRQFGIDFGNAIFEC
eukprot:TRINITY_DN10182_c0_g1_i10.p2 TRINITY_DN10182_c0_g1~~TRINITY_DN10182_c0_g1_i10.p2  ORF type:complete len:136 (-),score=25.85 TRINITY_DN10182_c0_g1_i10:115-522(-)